MTTIEVFADIWCPFTHVGLRAIDGARRAAGRDDLVIRVRAWPLELVNGEPMDAAKALHHARDLREQVAPELFAHLDVTHFPTSTLDALALAEAAYAVDDGTGERVSFALRDALFEEGRDVSDPTVLAEIATRAGVAMPDAADRAAVMASWAEGRARGVVGSPHFFCGAADVFCPTLDMTRDEHGLTIRRDTSALEAFIAACLGA